MFRLQEKINKIFEDHLYRNSMYITLSRSLNAASGFLFWVIAARYYSINDVGNATALISSLGLIMLLSRFGFDYSIIRFVPISDKNRIFNTSFIITTISSLAVGLVYIFIIKIFNAHLAFSAGEGIIFILIALFNSMALIAGNMFLALRKGHYLLMQTIVISLRLLFLFPMVRFGDFGILLSLGFCYILSVISSMLALRKDIKATPLEIDKPFIKKSFFYSLQSYISNILIEAPSLILPILVLNVAGRKEAAVYYIAVAIGDLVQIIPYSLSHSLFIEGSHGRPLKQNILKVCGAAYLFLIPIALVIGILGKKILSFFGPDYLYAYDLLLLVIFACFFEVIFMIYISVQNINMRVDRNIKYNFVRFLLLIAISFALLPILSIKSVGYALIATHVILIIIIAAASFKRHQKQVNL